MKNNLNKQVFRIKNMMKRINESQFDEIFDRSNDEDASLNEQTSPYTVGQVLNAIRSIDNKMYTLKISRVGEGFVGAIITGPGTYEGNDLRKGFHAELYSKTPGQLSGNMEMGEFKIQ